MEEAGNSSRGRPEIAGKTSLRELAWFFLRLGTTAFGGPAAHIAMMEDEVVRHRQWVTREKFLDLLGAANLIPARVRRRWRSSSATCAKAGPGFC